MELMPEVYEIVIGMILPIPISFIKARMPIDEKNSWAIYLVALVISVIVSIVLVGAGSVLVQDRITIDWKEILGSAALIAATSQTSYRLFIKQLGLDEIIEGY